MNSSNSSVRIASFDIKRKYCSVLVGQSKCVIIANAKQSAEYVIPTTIKNRNLVNSNEKALLRVFLIQSFILPNKNFDRQSGETCKAIRATIGR